MVDWSLLATVFGVIFVAQLPGKSALAAVVLATRYRPWPVFWGSAVSLLAHSAVAVGAGGLLSLLPPRPVHVGAGFLFIASAALMLLQKGEQAPGPNVENRKQSLSAVREFSSTLAVVFVAEWGDLTQLGTAAFAARYGKPFTVFFGATLALWAVGAIAVFVGNKAGRLLNPALTKKIAAAVFALVGAALIAGIL